MTKNKFLVKTSLWLGIALLLAGYPQWAWSLTPQEVIAQVQARYDRAGSFKTWFKQESRLGQVGSGEKAEGWMYFQKPCRMRWQYESHPVQKEEWITDGHQVWRYIPQENLVMIYPMNQVLRSDLVMRFFSGMGQFSQDFQISWQRPPEAGSNFIIDLIPKKSQAELKRLTLTINPSTYLVENLEFTNALGEETRFAFSQIQLAFKPAADFFTFTPPPGVQVVKESLGSQ